MESNFGVVSPRGIPEKRKNRKTHRPHQKFSRRMQVSFQSSLEAQRKLIKSFTDLFLRNRNFPRYLRIINSNSSRKHSRLLNIIEIPTQPRLVITSHQEIPSPTRGKIFTLLACLFVKSSTQHFFLLFTIQVIIKVNRTDNKLIAAWSEKPPKQPSVRAISTRRSLLSG